MLQNARSNWLLTDSKPFLWFWLEEIIKDAENGNFEIEDSFEDVHSKSNIY
jgi:argininosuccinate lyase